MEKESVKEILEWVYCVIIAIILALIVRYFLGTPTVVKQVSMNPTLFEGQRLILNRLPRTMKKTPERGDIITFEAPIDLVASEKNIENPVAQFKEINGFFNKFIYYVLEIGKQSYIKRVIALPGEHIKIENGRVYINDELLEEDYLNEDVVTNSGGIYTDLVVPEGCIFAMGDNRPESKDCRSFGCIPIEKLEGKVVLRFWPLNVFGKV